VNLSGTAAVLWLVATAGPAIRRIAGSPRPLAPPARPSAPRAQWCAACVDACSAPVEAAVVGGRSEAERCWAARSAGANWSAPAVPPWRDASWESDPER